LSRIPDGAIYRGWPNSLITPTIGCIRRAFLLHTAKRKRTARTVADTADTSRLLDNLAQALLKDPRPGRDGDPVPLQPARR
jgi:hypothetical protein